MEGKSRQKAGTGRKQEPLENWNHMEVIRICVKGNDSRGENYGKKGICDKRDD